MSIASQQRSLDEVEIYLTPKEWIIRLVQKMRSYPNENDFMKAIAKEDYRECLMTKPFVKLDQQAQSVYPGKHPANIKQRNELSRELRTEFQKLKSFIYCFNGIFEAKATSILMAAGLQDSRLENLLQKDQFYDVARGAASWIRRTAGDHGKASTILGILRCFAYMPNPASQIEPLANNLTMLMKNALAHEAALKLAQDQYLDGYSILFRNIEDLLMQAIEFTTITVERLQEFSSIHQRAHIRAIRAKPGLIDVELIMKHATSTATLDILEVHGAHRWEAFRTQMKNELKSDMEASGRAIDKQ
jgi:hypothetical protein